MSWTNIFYRRCSTSRLRGTFSHLHKNIYQRNQRSNRKKSEMIQNFLFAHNILRKCFPAPAPGMNNESRSEHDRNSFCEIRFSLCSAGNHFSQLGRQTMGRRTGDPNAVTFKKTVGKASGICSSGQKRSPTDPGAYSRSEMILTPFFPVK